MQQLVAARGEHDLIDRQFAQRIGIAIRLAEAIEDLLPQAGIAERSAVLQRCSGRGGLRQDLLQGLTGDFGRQVC